MCLRQQYKLALANLASSVLHQKSVPGESSAPQLPTCFRTPSNWVCLPISEGFVIWVGAALAAFQRRESEHELLTSAWRLSSRTMCWLLEEFFSRKSSRRVWTCRESCRSTSDACKEKPAGITLGVVPWQLAPPAQGKVCRPAPI